MIKRKYMKKTIATSMAVMAGCLTLSALPVQAASADCTTKTKSTSKISVEDFEYDLKDRYEAIEIDFLTNVNLKKDVKVSVTDKEGNSYKTSIHEHDKDDISLDVSKLKSGKTYTVKIQGIKKSSASNYGNFQLTFSIPKATSLEVENVEYDVEDKEVSFDFDKNISYENVSVQITNQSGTKSYKTTIVERDKDELTVAVSGLKYGSTYSYKITGVKVAKTAKTLTGSFKALDN